MTQKYIELNLNDEKSGKIAGVLSNKTAKKILSLLAEEELSEGDIAKKLSLAANTVNYNIKKLLDAGLIEKNKAFFWSVKGKKIPTYKLANKKIIISTKSSFKGLLGSVIAGGVILGAVKFWMNDKIIKSAVNLRGYQAQISNDLTYSAQTNVTEKVSSTVTSNLLFHDVFIWVLIGALIGLGVYFILKKVRLKGGKNKI